MRSYYEALDISGNFIRSDITNISDINKDIILNSMKLQFSGTNYKLLLHLCGHEDGKCCQEILI